MFSSVFSMKKLTPDQSNDYMIVTRYMQSGWSTVYDVHYFCCGMDYLPKSNSKDKVTIRRVIQGAYKVTSEMVMDDNLLFSILCVGCMRFPITSASGIQFAKLKKEFFTSRGISIDDRRTIGTMIWNSQKEAMESIFKKNGIVEDEILDNLHPWLISECFKIFLDIDREFIKSDILPCFKKYRYHPALWIKNKIKYGGI